MFDRFRNASTTQQIQLIVAAVCVVALVLIAVWYFLLRTVYQPLFGDLRPTDAATIVSALERKKIPYRLANGGTVILVPDDMVDATRLELMTDDVPLKGTVGFELFNKSDMGLTDFAQKINYQRALQGELERTIMTLDGVDSARVHLSLGEDRLFRDDRVPPKASVTVRMARKAVLSPDAAQGVKRLVAAAVPNLDVANVVILDEEGDVVSGPPQPVAPETSPLTQEKSAIETYYEGRIRIALQRANLPANIAVSVEAETVADAASTDPASALSSWSPGTRSFALSVTLSPGTPLDPQAQQNVRTAVASAIASSTAQDDVITFGPVVEAVAPVPAGTAFRRSHEAVPVVPALAPMPDEDRDLILEVSFALALVAAVIVALVMTIARLRRPRRMDERRRAEFAARLRTALEGREGDAALRP